MVHITTGSRAAYLLLGRAWLWTNINLLAKFHKPHIIQLLSSPNHYYLELPTMSFFHPFIRFKVIFVSELRIIISFVVGLTVFSLAYLFSRGK